MPFQRSVSCTCAITELRTCAVQTVHTPSNTKRLGHNAKGRSATIGTSQGQLLPLMHSGLKAGPRPLQDDTTRGNRDKAPTVHCLARPSPCRPGNIIMFGRHHSMHAPPTHSVHSIPISIGNWRLANSLQAMVKIPPGLICGEVANNDGLKEAWTNFCKTRAAQQQPVSQSVRIQAAGLVAQQCTDPCQPQLVGDCYIMENWQAASNPAHAAS